MIIRKAAVHNLHWLDEQYQHKIADHFFQNISDETQLVLENLQKKISLDDIERALSKNKPAFIIDSISWSESFDDKLVNKWKPVLNSIMALTGTESWKQLKISISFNIKNPYAFKWIEKHAAEFVKQVSDETKQAIRRVIHDGFRIGKSPREMSRIIQGTIGLTERDAKAVLNYWERLSQEADLSATRVNTMTDTYEKQLLRKRALKIARTETLNASNEGIRISWLVARDEGYLLPETKRVWLAAAGSCRTCEICLSYNNKEAGLDEPFKSEFGERMGPPGHVCNCRCTCGLVTK